MQGGASLGHLPRPSRGPGSLGLFLKIRPGNQNSGGHFLIRSVQSKPGKKILFLKN